MSTTTATIAPEINSWTRPGTGQTRRYINNWSELVGVEVGRYNTGNISWATFDGERISNGEAGRILAGKVWIDEADALHFDYHTRCTVSEGIKAERIEAALREHGII